MQSTTAQMNGVDPSNQAATPQVASSKWSWPLAAVSRFPKRPKHVRSYGSNRLTYALAVGLTGVLTLTGVAAGAAANNITGNISAVDADHVLRQFGAERPTVVPPDTIGAGSPLNVLVLGVDARFGENAEYAGDAVMGARADTTIVLHISADRQHVSAISIPRDSIVNIPSCPTTTPGQATSPRSNTRFNAAFAAGYDLGGDIDSGALCTLTTVESLTNVRMDGFVVLDFAGFKGMVDALGGVEMDIPNAINAPLADGLVLDPGIQRLNGWQALQLARARTGEGLGDGSDLTRIGRQQDLMTAIARQVVSTNMLTEFPTLLRFLSTTTNSMTASSNFASLQGLAGLGYSLNGINVNNIDFVMVPIATNPEDPNTVVWTRAADELWHNVRYNNLRGEQGEPSIEANDGATETPVAQGAGN